MKPIMKSVQANIRVGEIPALANAMVENFKKCASATENELFSACFSELEELTKKSICALNSEKVSGNLDELDSARDEAWRVLGKGLEGHAALQKGEKKEAALSLLDVYARHGGKNATKLNFAAESSTLESAIEEFSSPEMMAKVKLLGGVEEALDALKDAQSAFAAKVSEVSGKAASAKSEKSSTELKKQILSCINDKILPLVSASALILSDKYSEFASVIAEDIARANSSTSRHSTKKGETSASK